MYSSNCPALGHRDSVPNRETQTALCPLSHVHQLSWRDPRYAQAGHHLQRFPREVSRWHPDMLEPPQLVPLDAASCIHVCQCALPLIVLIYKWTSISCGKVKKKKSIITSLLSKIHKPDVFISHISVLQKRKLQ